jgi:hypothetical protein
MFVLVRAVTYAALFIGLVLIYVPGRLLTGSGIVRPAVIGAPQIAGMIVGKRHGRRYSEGSRSTTTATVSSFLLRERAENGCSA